MKLNQLNNHFRAVICGFVLALVSGPSVFAQRRVITLRPAPPIKIVRLQTLPKATVWVDEIKRGVADDAGMLEIKQLGSGSHVFRIRATGFKEFSRTLRSPFPNPIVIKPVTKADTAEMAFQAAESAELTAKDDTARQAVVEQYQKAISLRRIYPEAHLGLARVLLELGDSDAALEEIEIARRQRPGYAEASAVEGRIKRTIFDAPGAIVAFQRSIREARGFQPEAHTGLALAYQDQGNDADAAVEFKKAIDQLADTEPIIYQLLGATYEKLEKYKEAVDAYERYLALAPNGNLAPAIRSMIDQLRRQANGDNPLQ